MIKGQKLKSMLPPFLVDLDLTDLKGLCLEQVGNVTIASEDYFILII